ncbi:hypothetical protein NE237_028632 [Protea cynaroides]|uniref:Uncharacterized protein n=1 Tax=Protea cynaroides TaxID=273540 RepID=A0A9Q0JVB6_9MAGN|nr:hypothetical protein NE237_028632 [Protea cynaroides]
MTAEVNSEETQVVEVPVSQPEVVETVKVAEGDVNAKGGDRWPRLLEGSRNKEKSEIEKKREKSGGFSDFVLGRNQKPRGKIWRGFTPAVEFHEEAMAAYGGGSDCYCLRRLERELRLFVRETRGKEDRGCYL